MPARWTPQEESEKRAELRSLYVDENLTIFQIGQKLHLHYGSVYERLVRLSIPIQPWKKPRHNNIRKDISLPNPSIELAEFIGIMLGDGCITPTQITVCLGNKEKKYWKYVTSLIHKLFGVKPKWTFSKEGYCTIYLGSTAIVRWLLKMGLVHNKVREQVDIPRWVWRNTKYSKAVIRGLFDTDGSVYVLKNGSVQISLRNFSLKLLISARNILVQLGYSPSKITVGSIYLTRRLDTAKYFKEIGFNNPKHMVRYVAFSK